ncbi:MAG: hypothetical protein PHS80_10910 [Methanothrix sp.]|nr:hypothetical protein [Methanothrix sp.]MDD4446863.1 hypothetical protein [Methanothrix sp.]
MTETQNSGMSNNRVNKFEEYSLFIEDTARLSERRQTISNTYVAVNSLLLVAIGLLIKDLGATGVWRLLLPVPLIVSGIIISRRWSELLSNYKKLVGFRINVLKDMEKKMSGIENMYHREELIYPMDGSSGSHSIHGLNFSDKEQALPKIFILLYCIFGLGLIAALIVDLAVNWKC